MLVGACLTSFANANLNVIAKSNVAAPIFDAQGGYELYFVNYEDLKTDIFYYYKFYGQNTTVANVEAGTAWFEHTLFTQSNVGGTYLGTGALGTVKNHATSVASIISGSVEFVEDENGGATFPIWLGIAPKSTIYSGAIATQFIVDEKGEESFDITGLSLYTTYHNFFVTNPVDVINSSWGATYNSIAEDEVTPILDAFAKQNALTTFVAAAGNAGPAANSVGSPAMGFNCISVGAYDNIDKTGIAEFSSRGPSDFYNPITKEIIKGVRAAVDISTSGVYISGANYDEAATPDKDSIIFASGTSFAAPLVSGVVSLMKSVSYDLEAKGTWINSDGRDSRVIKAVMLNAAKKPSDWDNGQIVKDDVKFKTPFGQGIYAEQTFNNVVTTSQGLDYNYGAGLVNAEETFVEYANHQWMLAEIQYGDKAYIEFNTPVWAGYTVTTTLTWFADAQTAAIFSADSPDVPVDFTVESKSFSNLDLEIWLITELGEKAIAISNSVYNSVEHLNILLEQGGTLRICVSFFDMVYGNAKDNKETFALAWNVAVPEASNLATILGILAFALALSRRKNYK